MTLDREMVLAATEDVLRRHGPSKANVVDVARALGVTHGAVYRYFPSKTALRAEVTRRWLGRSHTELAEIAAGTEPAPARLRAWLTAMFVTKRAVAVNEPELFATYGVLAAEHAEVAADHVNDLLAQLTMIIGELTDDDVSATARAVFDATAVFHHPSQAAEWTRPDIDDRFDAICELVLTALTPAPSTQASKQTPLAGADPV